MTHSTWHGLSLTFAMIGLMTVSSVRAQGSTGAIVETPQSTGGHSHSRGFAETSRGVLRTQSTTVAEAGADRDDPVRLPRFEVGVGVSPFFKAYLDAQPCCFPLSGWITVGSGRTRLQFDYLRNVRSQRHYYAAYFGETDAQGREIVVNRARSDFHVDQTVGAAIVWRSPTKGGTAGYLLAGAAYERSARRYCVALGKPDLNESKLPGQEIYVEFPAGHQCSNEPVDHTFQRVLPLYGVGLDVGFGSRFFSSVQYRARLHPLQGELRIGAGIRF